ncbi:unnamed protein product [Lactuca virosa]|uniref:Uncharacterized protein n=2 Tax=Lactuca virosa TaxID=75947 RepID=A0AAU9P0S5_9ASTR|nr:unnamed protein product [Lactuca virosa]
MATGEPPGTAAFVFQCSIMTSKNSTSPSVGSTAIGSHLKKIVHTKKRNRLETNRLNNLIYVQFNANLMEKNKKRKDRTLEVLLANDSHSAQEWIIDGDDGDGDEVDPESVMEAIDEALETNDNQVPRKSSTTRELYDEDFKSENEEQVFEEDEYESDGVKIVEELED